MNYLMFLISYYFNPAHNTKPFHRYHRPFVFPCRPSNHPYSRNNTIDFRESLITILILLISFPENISFTKMGLYSD